MTYFMRQLSPIYNGLKSDVKIVRKEVERARYDNAVQEPGGTREGTSQVPDGT